MATDLKKPLLETLILEDRYLCCSSNCVTPLDIKLYIYVIVIHQLFLTV